MKTTLNTRRIAQHGPLPLYVRLAHAERQAPAAPLADPRHDHLANRAPIAAGRDPSLRSG
ncbi:MAG TPA: hypothetical protein VJG32_14400 [Anaerolineae bacterium]|nr:hypothetical protein [Anaerolineae bacterium]